MPGERATLAWLAVVLAVAPSTIGCGSADPQLEASMRVADANLRSLGDPRYGFASLVPVERVPSPDVDKALPKLVGTIPPLVEGRGRMAFDCVERRCKVQEVLASTSRDVEARTICDATPCWADFAYGPHRFAFAATDLPYCGVYLELGACRTDDVVEVVATTNPVVVLVRVPFEDRSVTPKSRKLHEAKQLSFEVARGSPYYAR
jgi:hypothetical protein